MKQVTWCRTRKKKQLHSLNKQTRTAFFNQVLHIICDRSRFDSCIFDFSNTLLNGARVENKCDQLLMLMMQLLIFGQQDQHISTATRLMRLNNQQTSHYDSIQMLLDPDGSKQVCDFFTQHCARVRPLSREPVASVLVCRTVRELPDV